MRKILFIISLFTFTAASAQVAKWVIHPLYEHIRMLGDGYRASVSAIQAIREKFTNSPHISTNSVA